MLIKHDRRRNKTSSRMPAVLAIVLCIMYTIAITGLMFVEIPQGNREALVIMCGTLSTMLGMAMAFYFNTTQSSRQKDQVIADMVASDKVLPDNSKSNDS